MFYKKDVLEKIPKIHRKKTYARASNLIKSQFYRLTLQAPTLQNRQTRSNNMHAKDDKLFESV